MRTAKPYTVKVSKVGNSFGFTFRKSTAAQCGIKEGDEMILSCKNKVITVRPVGHSENGSEQ